MSILGVAGRSGVQDHLTLAFPLKSDADVKTLARKLSPLMSALARAADAIGTVHYSRFVLLSEKTLLFLADFDGKLDKVDLSPALSADEQRLLSQGYKPQMRNGEKIYCRREAQLGSRIPDVQHCGTVTQLKDATLNGQDYAEKAQRTQLNPAGN
jgi:hypothetical protein